MLVKRRHSRPIPEGATIFERDGKRYARWTMASGQIRILPLNRKGTKMVAESERWYVRLTDPQTGKLKEWRAYNDRQASLALEIELIKQLERGEAGLSDPMAVHRKKKIDDHLVAFEGHLEDKGNTNDHIDRTIARCRRIIEKIGAKTLADITAEGVDTALASFRRKGMGLSTSNGYFRAMRTFCRWLVRTRRMRENPIAELSCIRVTDADRRRRRRNLSDEEVQALIAAAERSPEPFMGISGTDRAMLYMVAINTGLRASELASLTPESFELNCKRPVVRCHGGYTKNRAEAVLPLRRDLVNRLRDWLQDKPAREPVWGSTWAGGRHAAMMMRIDLTAANIEYEDGNGRFADFHALRHTFISNLARAGVHPRNAQALARHSTIDLTMNVYTHVSMGDLADAVESLPGSNGQGHASATPPPAASALPGELANLASNWSSLPEHVRTAISALAGV